MSPRSTGRATAVASRLISLLGAAGCVLSACQGGGIPVDPTITGDPSPAVDGPMSRSEVIPGSFLVVFQPGVADPPGLAKQLVSKHGGTVRFAYRAALKGFAADLPDQAVEALKHNPNVAYVEPDQVVQVSGTEPAPPAPWGLDRVDQRSLPLSTNYSWGTTGAGVTVYGIDTGILSTHVEFSGRLLPGADFVKGKWSTEDCNGHGTHTAGTFGGMMYGVAKGVRIVPVRVLDCYGNGTWSGVIAGVDWVTANHVSPAVANMSLGGGYSQAVNDAVEASIRSGVTYTVAAGNSSWDACNISPASAPDAITLGASDSLDQQAVFSNYGRCLSLYGPGVRIKSAFIGSDTASRYGSGTSMAAPHAAGAAALYLETHPAAAPAEVQAALVTAATQGQITKIGTGSPNLLLFTGDPTTAQPGGGSGGGGSGGPCKQRWQKGCP
jgi:subtilisin family serine protease